MNRIVPIDPTVWVHPETRVEHLQRILPDHTGGYALLALFVIFLIILLRRTR